MKTVTKLIIVLMLAYLLTMNQSTQNQIASAQSSHRIYLPTVSNIVPTWAYQETFDGDPSSPSQSLLPDDLDFSVTHRTVPGENFRVFNSYPADHGNNCDGPNPNISPLPQHAVTTSHFSNSTNPDPGFFICKNHMMSSMGDVEAYSVTAFWPRQEFDFSQGGTLEFDVNINDNHHRSWFEIMITPRSELKVGAAHEDLPIDETYPKDRIIFEFMNNKRYIQVGTGAIDPLGKIVEQSDGAYWSVMYPNDPANVDRRIRRPMHIKIEQNQITWSIQKADGTFDDFSVAVPGGLPFTRGLVVFKTHAYTPNKDGNRDMFTFHWDNIRFSGPVVGRYESFEANDVIYLQENGNRQIGEKQSVSINLPHIGPNPVLFGQVHNPMRGQVLLSVNGRPNIVVNPYDYNPGTCSSSGWKSFQLPIDPAWLKVGNNTFTWTIGPRPGCADQYLWNGFSIMGLEVQFDLP
ncbi:MAG: hypothetical protein H6667_12970 [Ardenticatenaceae bacterium]|nr:hypothetical protein [Ardenticatenaceae bacterium]MCB9442655.1 hypothetical protein [Ardenticatenaceae bacterium]